MFFTREDILKIQNALLKLSVKDSELPSAEPVTYDDTLSIVQDGKNKQIKIKDFFNQISLWKREDFINITDKYDEHYISLIEAINLVPILQRKDGLVITFQDIEGNWEIYQFRGNITEFFNIEKWFNLYDYRNNIIQSIVPDEEDLTASIPDENKNSLVSLKDRVYDPTSFSSKGYKILRKNIQPVNIAVTKIKVEFSPSSDGILSFSINGKETQVSVSVSVDNTTTLVADKIATKLTETMTEYEVLKDASTITLIRKFGGSVTPSIFSASTTGIVCTVTDSTKREFRNILTPIMINQPNTIYEIRYDFDLDGETIEMQKGCTLKFEGGSLKNGKIIGYNSTIKASGYNILNNTLIEGFDIPYLDIRWVGGVSDYNPNTNKGTDNSFAFQRAHDIAVINKGLIIIIVGSYYINHSVECVASLNLWGYYNNSRILAKGYSDEHNFEEFFGRNVSQIIVDNCAAFNLNGYEKSYNKDEQYKFNDINFAIKNLYLTGLNNSTFLNIKAIGAPSRLCLVKECNIVGFDNFIYSNCSSDDSRYTLIGNLHIVDCNVYANGYFINITGNKQSLCNMNIDSCVIEQNTKNDIKNTIKIERCYGTNTINNCIFENEIDPIKITFSNTIFVLTNNYFEDYGNVAFTFIHTDEKYKGQCGVYIVNNHIITTDNNAYPYYVSGCDINAYIPENDQVLVANMIRIKDKNVLNYLYSDKSNCICSNEAACMCSEKTLINSGYNLLIQDDIYIDGYPYRKYNKGTIYNIADPLYLIKDFDYYKEHKDDISKGIKYGTIKFAIAFKFILKDNENGNSGKNGEFQIYLSNASVTISEKIIVSRKYNTSIGNYFYGLLELEPSIFSKDYWEQYLRNDIRLTILPINEDCYIGPISYSILKPEGFIDKDISYNSIPILSKLNKNSDICVFFIRKGEINYVQDKDWSSLYKKDIIPFGIGIKKDNGYLVYSLSQNNLKWSNEPTNSGIYLTDEEQALLDDFGDMRASMQTKYVAQNYCLTYKNTIGIGNWRLPSLVELKLALQNKDRLNNILQEIDSAKLFTDAEYWSCVEYDKDSAWQAHILNNTVLFGANTKTINEYCVRPCYFIYI